MKAALKAQIAIGIAILTFAPVRIGNLVRSRLDDNLIQPGGPEQPFWLVYPEHDVKNRVTLEFALDDELSSLIREYLFDHRPVLQRGINEPWLFPGTKGGHKRPHHFGGQIARTIRKRTGLKMTAHQMRHAAATLILQAHPGAYEMARRVLGHKRSDTTAKFYAGLETLQATRMFGDIVRQSIDNNPMRNEVER